MSEFKLIKKYLRSLEIYRANLEVKVDMEDVILASDLEKALESATVMYGNDADLNIGGIGNKQDRNDTHQGLLLGYQPIQEKAVTKDEILELLNDLRSSMNVIGGEESLGEEIRQTVSLINRLEKQGEIK